MKRRLSLVASSLALLAAVGVGSAQAATGGGAFMPRDDTNGCVLVEPLALAVCIPRF